MAEFQLRRKGMENPGSLCYMNAMLQQLFSMNEFRRTVLDLSQLTTSQDVSDVVDALVHICKNIESFSSKPIETITLYENIQKHLKAVMDIDQCRDATDFFSELISVFSCCFTSSELPNPFDVMKGSLINIIHANEDPHGKRMVHSERFYYVSLPVCGLDCSNLQESLTQFTKSHQFPFKWRDIDGNYMNTPLLSSKSTKFQQLPPYLVFHLKRFKYDSVNKRKCKVFDHFAFPRILDMNPYVEDGNDINTKREYALTGLVIHVGKSAYTGHYYSLLRNDNASSDGCHEWFIANDEEVLPFPSASLEKLFFGNNDIDSQVEDGEKDNNDEGDDSNDDDSDDDDDSLESEEDSDNELSFRDIVDFENTSYFRYHTTQMLVYTKIL